MLLLVGLVPLALAIIIGAYVVADRAPSLEEGLRTARREMAERRISERTERDRKPAELPSLYVRLGALASRLTPSDYARRLQSRLDIAGNPPSWPTDRVLAFKGIGLVLLGLIGLGYGAKYGFLQALLGLVIGAAVGFFLPDVLIKNAGDKRQAEIRRQLPDLIDMMTVCVEAGLGFEGALSRVAQNLPGPASAEFARVIQEMQFGSSRTTALRAAAERTTVSEMRTFISSVIQATELGITMGEVLRAQAGQMRIRRRQLAEERAQKLPVKILGPLILFILPPMFIVLLGPAILNITTFFGVH